MTLNFGRLLTAMVTPMKPDQSIDLDRAGELAERLVEEGSDGIVVCGTTGESPTLTDEEKLDLFRVVVEAVGGKASVVAGTGSNSTMASRNLTKAAQRTGVDGIMLVVPYYNKPPQQALYQHFKDIAAVTELPLMLYNVPGRTACNLEADTVVRLAEIHNIVALKEASSNLGQIGEIVARTPDTFAVYSGNDSETLPVMSVGGVGVVSVISHVAGQRMRQMVEAFESGHVLEAARINSELTPIYKGLFLTTNPIPVKVAMRMIGFDCGPFRLPLAEPSKETSGAIEAALRQGNVL